ncbi:NADP-dependent oxidoreductase, partial [Streptomyces chromofuscus]|uniref:NADP-dependent oxidoreductase n=1 Tax=Streptomyces chromofuscus TaxID=42881 RepID=UPI0027E550E5
GAVITCGAGTRWWDSPSMTAPRMPHPRYTPHRQTADTDLRIGDRVMAVTMPTEPRGGAYSQYLTLPAHAVVRAPAGATPAEAATLPMNGLTARLALDLADVSAGQTLAVIGAAGVVGGYVTQMARAEGITVIADAAPSDEGLVRSLGADMVVLRGPGVAHRILDAVPGGVDGLVDAAGLGSAVVAAAVHDGGAIVALSGDGLRPLSPAELRRRSLRKYLVFVPDYLGDHGRLDRLRRQVEAGEVTPRVARVLSAERAAEAHRLMEAGGVRGRLVLEF